MRPKQVFIHRSIKTRIETEAKKLSEQLQKNVFIHRSIKTRIETGSAEKASVAFEKFLYIDPLKQGLKLSNGNINIC